MTAGQKAAADSSPDDWAARRKLTTECAFKMVIQVRADKVWVGTFYGDSDETSTIGTYETFPRPAEKTHAQCVARAIQKASKWVPEDFSKQGVVVSDW